MPMPLEVRESGSEGLCFYPESDYGYHMCWGNINYRQTILTEETIGNVPNLVRDFAQPYTQNEAPVTIAGISAFLSTRFNRNNSGNDPNGALNSYLEIRDNTLENVLAKVEIPANTINTFCTSSSYSDTNVYKYTEVFFDSAITVSSDFYVVLHTPDSIDLNLFNSEGFPFSIGTATIDEPCAERYPLPKIRDWDMTWIALDEQEEHDAATWTQCFANAFYLFPILAEDSVSGLQDADKEQSVQIFPQSCKR